MRIKESLFTSCMILLLQGICFQGFAQATTNSLLTLLHGDPPDSTRIDLYIALHKNLLKGDTTQAIAYLRKAISISEHTGDRKRMARSYLQLARYYDRKGRLPDAQHALATVAQQLRYFRDSSIEAPFYTMRGIIYYYEGDYNLAVNDLWIARARYEELGDSATVASCYLIIGVAYQELEKLDKALEYFQKCLVIYKQVGDEKGVAMASGNMGVVFKKNKEYDKALEYYNQSLQVHEKYGYTEDVRIDLSNIGNVYMAKENYEKAYEFYEQSKEIAESLGSQIDILSSAYDLALLESKLGNHQQSIQNFQEIIKTATGLHYKYLIKESYLALSDVYQETGNFFRALISREEYEIWNENASVYLSKFSKLVWLILENAETTKVSLQSELALLESYIQLEALRFKGKIDYTIKVDASIDPDDTYLPSMVLQPFVENAIWHGLMHKKGGSEKGVIEVSINEENNRLYCIIEDNGVGREKARELQEQSVLKKKSLGMKITEERLRLLSKEQVEQLVRITNLKDAFNQALGTRVEINIPVSS